MILRITMKDPDGVWESIDNAIRSAVRADCLPLTEDEQEELVESRREKVSQSLRAWLDYLEYVTIEVDTDANTARVVPVKED